MQSTPDVSARNLSRTFGDFTAVSDFSLDVPRGAFVTLLGPSGCGKTTTLRMIGGFEHPDSGEIVIQGQTMGTTPPHARDTSMVFQNYALFPHMTVYDNIAFGLRERKVNRSDIDSRVRAMLELVELAHMEHRKPGELSGGQQQRVALARSLVIEPTVLLLDEPLGALDHKLRKQMQHELKRIQQRLGITFIYVTHDQEEALAMSDRIVVMRSGQIEQEGNAEEIFARPNSRYVAEFMGAENVLPVQIRSQHAELAIVHLAGRQLEVPVMQSPPDNPHLVIRPEHIRIDSENGWEGEVVERTFRGSAYSYRVELLDGTVLTAHIPIEDGVQPHQPGDTVRIDFHGADAVLVTG